MSRLLIIDDHEMVREGLEALIKNTGKYNLVESVGTIDGMREKMREHTFDLIIMDLKLNNESGIDGIAQIKMTSPETKILILSGFIEQHYVNEALRVGVEGYLHKSTDFEHLKSSIDSILDGGTVFVQTVTAYQNNQLQDSCCSNLTKRQKEIINLLCLGKTNREIGVSMSISEKTVRNDMSEIFKKITVSNRSEAIGCCIYNK